MELANGRIGENHGMMFRQLVDSYKASELILGRLSPSTVAVYRQYLAKYVLPQWGEAKLKDVRPVPVERWLATLPYSAGTKAKIRNIMSAVFQHAKRNQWVDQNPIRDVRQSAKRQTEPDILEPAEIRSLLEELPEPSKTMALVAVLTGLRISEVLGLKWADLDFVKSSINLQRGVVNQHVTPLKTAGSRRSLPIPEPVVKALLDWREFTPFDKLDDWVFASPSMEGRQPFWPATLLQRHVHPATRRAGLRKRVGWHTFRRSFATLLNAQGADVKTVQELMRHATPNVTLGVYAQAVTENKRTAQQQLTKVILGPSSNSNIAPVPFCS